MGGRRRQRQQGPKKGSDLQCEVEIDFKSACFGIEKMVSVRREETCASCDGKGMEKGREQTKCAQCAGQGAVLQVIQTPLGTMQTQSVCPSCQGSGIDPSSLCAECR